MVFAVRDVVTDACYACKVVAKSTMTKPRQWKKMKAEIKIHQSVSSEHVVRFERCFEDDKHVYILMELCSNKTLWDIVKTRGGMGEAQAACYLREALSATAHLHAMRIVHRDLKLGNLFLTQEGLDELNAEGGGAGSNAALGKPGAPTRLKIGDFGLACVMEGAGDRRKTICGTPNYIAPEVLQGKEGEGHSYEVDTWSLGVILYTLLFGTPPFQSKDVKLTYKRIRTNEYEIPDHPPIANSTKDLIRSVLHPEPHKRPTLAEFAAHPFMKLGAEDWTLNVADGASAPPPPHDETERSSSPEIKSRKLNERDDTKDAIGRLRSPLQAIDPNTKSEARQKKEKTYERDGDGGRATRLTVELHVDRTATVSSSATGENPERDPALDVKFQAMHLQPDDDSSVDVMKYFPPLWVQSWVDYTSQYGIGYRLSDGTVGVSFNDESSVTFMSNEDSSPFVYEPSPEGDASLRQSSSADDAGRGRPEGRFAGRMIVNQQDVRMYGRETTKKLIIAKHFREFFKTDNDVVQRSRGGLPHVLAERSPYTMPPYVKMWTRTSKGMLWQLSNKTIQVNFRDGAEILLSPTHRLVSYVSASGVRRARAVEDIRADDRELVDAMNHVKHVLDRISADARAPARAP